MIDLKERLKNSGFWIGAVGVVGTFAVGMAQLLGVDITGDVDSISKLAVMVITTVFAILAATGVVVNPTTPGLTDGDQAKSEKEGASE